MCDIVLDCRGKPILNYVDAIQLLNFRFLFNQTKKCVLAAVKILSTLSYRGSLKAGYKCMLILFFLMI